MLVLNDLLDNVEAHADALVVHLSRPQQFPEACEERGHVLLRNPVACVLYLEHKLAFALLVLVVYLNVDRASLCKLDCILHQIDEDLLESAPVANQLRH